MCPYCAIGCGQLIHHKAGKLVSIEGDPASPISRGHLCPKGSASFELLTHPDRLKKVRYRKPRSSQWETLDLETGVPLQLSPRKSASATFADDLSDEVIR